ncbi:MAG: sulfite exporter TauE/SafE family protein [bacterium]|nr:sulfite exporter TauE/SafE family protein [bacterium]
MELLPIGLCVFVVAMLYSSVGHGGATGYIAVLTLFSFSNRFIGTTSLLLNVVVSAIALFHFMKARQFSWRLLLPLIITSVPASFLGGMLTIDRKPYMVMISTLLTYAAILMLRPESTPSKVIVDKIHIYLLPILGAGVGYISGVLGIGGGILISPMFILLNWATPSQTSAIAAGFILLNSIAGLAGRFFTGVTVTTASIGFLAIAALGGFIGSYWGANRFSSRILRKLLAVVLLTAALKTVFDFVRN